MKVSGSDNTAQKLLKLILVNVLERFERPVNLTYFKIFELAQLESFEEKLKVCLSPLTRSSRPEVFLIKGIVKR